MQIKTGTSLVVSSRNSCGKNGRVLVLGLGNVLLKDEGVGVHIAGQLQKQVLPDNVEVVDGGTAGLDILLAQEGLYKLVVIDAMRAGRKPGTIYKTRLKAEGSHFASYCKMESPGEKDRLIQVFSQTEQSKISLHQVGLLDALSVAEKMNCAPREIVIIGVEPGEVDCGLELTEPVKRSVPEVVKKVLEEIKDDIHRK